MPSRAPRRTRAAAALLLALGLLSGVAGADEAELIQARRVAQVLSAEHPDGDLEGKLADLEPVPLDALLRIHVDRAVPAAWTADGVRLPLSAEQLAAVRGAFRSAPAGQRRASLQVFLEDGPSWRERGAALEMLRGGSAAEDLLLALRIASHDDPEGLVPGDVRGAFVSVLDEALTEEPSSLYVLRALYERAPDGLVAPIVRAMGKGEPRQGVSLFTTMLGRDAQVDPILLATIAERGPALPRPVDEVVLATVRAYLDSPRLDVVRLAVRAAGSLDDYDAIRELIGLLAHDDPNVRRAATRSLTQITRVHLGTRPESWTRWYEGELAWWEERSSTAFFEVAGYEPAVALQSLLEISRQRLYRDELVAGLAPALGRDEQQIVATVCRVLGTIGCAAAIPHLENVLETAGPAVRLAASRALEALEAR